jgi:hypothetical protein
MARDRFYYPGGSGLAEFEQFMGKISFGIEHHYGTMRGFFGAPEPFALAQDGSKQGSNR